MSKLTKTAICGYLADRSKSRQLPLLVGLGAMACSTLMLHFGAAIWILILARVFQGLAAAVLYSAGLALLYDSVGKDKVGEAMGYITLAITAGTFLGPSLGGVLYSVGKEAATFGLAYGIIGVDLVLRLLVIEKDAAKSSEESANGSEYGTMNAARAESNHVSESFPQAGNRQAEISSPTLRLLKSPRLWTALFGWFAVAVLLTAFDSVIPIFVQSTFDWPTAGAGIIFIPLFLPDLGAPLFGRIVDSSEQAGRLLAAAGFMLCLPFFVLLRLIQDSSIKAQILLCVFLFMIGLGLAVCGPPTMVEAGRTVTDIEEKNPGAFGSEGATARAYGLYNCAFAAGQLVGPLWAGGVKTRLGWATMAWMLGLASGLTALIMGLFLGGWVGSVRWRRKGGKIQAARRAQEQERLLS
ncbi:MAG: hypothetical protein M1835_006306 [Candelina submexicana]|nr:MAG: hypothetical protein M1835_006306 [Candelina submexicana]